MAAQVAANYGERLAVCAARPEPSAATPILAGHVPAADFDVQASHDPGQPRPGSELASASEARDLGEHDQGGEPAT
jgi:hypothetical protein